MDNQNESYGCGPISNPAAKDFGLPCGGRCDADSSPNLLKMDKAINDRCGKPGDAWSGMSRPTEKDDAFNGPGMSRSS